MLSDANVPVRFRAQYRPGKSELWWSFCYCLCDIAQLPTVGDKPLYHSMPETDKKIRGHLMYQQFKKVVALTVNHRVDGNSNEKHVFRDLLLRERNGESTPADWHTLLSRTPDRVSNIQAAL